MSEYQHPGLHPDADSLNAFIEGVLPAHEHLECLAHLADCPRCREIVYLAQEPVAPAPIASDPVPFWKHWFAIPVLAAAVACVLLVSIGIYSLTRPKRAEPVLTAVATPPIEPSAPSPEPLKQTPAPRSAKSIAVRQLALPAERPAITQNPAPSAAPVALAPPPPPPPPPAPAPFSAAQQAFVETQSAQLPNPAAGIATAGISGTVTDPAGDALPGALVTARPVTGTSNLNTRTDNKGQFNFNGLPPGQYELQFLSPGFKQAKKQIDLQPQLVARADSILEVGAATDTITVTNGAPLLKTESGEISHTITTNPVATLPQFSANSRTPLNESPALLPATTPIGLLKELPGKATPSTTASRDKLMLKADSAGTLFFSKNGGKSWKAVKPGWQGKVVRVESAHDPGAVFQLTTDSGSVWLSRDGAHWNPAPAPRRQ